jgi:spore maturation protein SpmB
MGAMVMNMAANMLGLGNAATPFGLKAMTELNRLNPYPGVATDAMVLFLVINATAIHLMPPTGTMAVRAAEGSASPAAIWVPTLFATACAMTVGLLTVFVLRGRERYAARPLPGAAATPASDTPFVPDVPAELTPVPAASPLRSALALGVGLALLVAIVWQIAQPWQGVPWPARTRLDVAKEIANQWLIAILIVALLLVGLRGGVRIYDSMVAGAREGLDVVVRIAPYLVVILVAAGMFRASGALALIIGAPDPFTSAIGFPAEALPMALLRPLSGSGAFAVMAEILHTHGPDSFVGMVASTLQGSTETTFYVLTVYFGSVGIREMRHVIPACLLGDLAGFAGATAACHLFFR